MLRRADDIDFDIDIDIKFEVEVGKKLRLNA
jgi:hypothetical protein